MHEPDGHEVGLPKTTTRGRSPSRFWSALPVEHEQQEGSRTGAVNPRDRGDEDRGGRRLLLQPSPARWRRWVSYHFSGEPELILDDPDVDELLSDLHSPDNCAERR